LEWFNVFNGQSFMNSNTTNLGTIYSVHYSVVGLLLDWACVTAKYLQGFTFFSFWAKRKNPKEETENVDVS
jgi:hypothetical protein